MVSNHVRNCQRKRTMFRVESVPQKEYNIRVSFGFYGGFDMEYVSTSEIALIWDVSRRRVTTLCREGRIEGAVFAANTWLVPKDAKNRYSSVLSQIKT